MNRLKISLACLMLVPTLIFSQSISNDFEVSTGTPYEVIDALDKRYISVGDGNIISIKTREDVVTIQRFNAESMKEIARVTYEDFPKYNHVQDVVFINGKLFYIYEAYNKKDKAKSFSVYSREVNIYKPSFINNKKLFTSSRAIVNLPKVQAGMGSLGANRFGKRTKVIKSMDGTKVLIMYVLNPESRKNSKNFDVVGFNVFDANMNLLWSKEVEMKHTEKEIDNLTYAVGKDGSVYMLYFLNEEKKIGLIKVNKDGEMTNTTIDINVGFVYGKFEMTEDANGNILCASYYANSFYMRGQVPFDPKGVYLFIMTQEGELLKKTEVEFSPELITKYLTDSQKEEFAKKEVGVKYLMMKKMMVQENGCIIIVGEQRHLTHSGEKYSHPLYHYGSVIITKLDKDGKHLWSKKIPKNQVAGSTYLRELGVTHFEGNGKHYLFFIDNPENENLPLNEEPKVHSKFITAFEINDSDGELKRHTVLDLKDISGVTGYQFEITRILEVEDKSFLMELYIRGKNDTMVKMRLK